MRKYVGHGLMGVLACFCSGCLEDNTSKLMLVMKGEEITIRDDILICSRCDLTGTEIPLNPKNNTSNRTDTNRHPKAWTGTIRP